MSETEIIAFVEIPKGSRNKYEYDEELGAVRLDRFLFTSMVYPADYGFVPETVGEDDDPLDVIICVSEPTFPGCRIVVKPVALFRMRDEHGVDDKVVCVPVSDPAWGSVEDIDDLPEPLRREIGHFFDVYKDLEPHKHSEVLGWHPREEALRIVREARERHAAAS